MLFRFVDLQIISVLIEYIRKEFRVSDTALGLLSGFAFALFYGALGVPVAWMAERRSRTNIVSIALALWSAATMLCGAANSFGMLLLCRLGVGFGEAGSVPPSSSLVSDYFAKSERPKAFAILNAAVPCGVFVGFLIGSWVAKFYGWRAAFVVVGAPGLILAILVRALLREPPRGHSDGARASDATAPDFRAAVRHLLSIRAYRHLVMGSSIFTVGAVGSGMWISAFFTRVHHMDPLVAGTALAFVYGGGGVVGALAGGWLTAKVIEKTGVEAWTARLPAAFCVALLPSCAFVYLTGSASLALLVHVINTVLMHAWMGPTYSAVQTLAGARRRAVAAAVNLFAVNLIALSIGPLLVGMLSDRIGGIANVDSLRYAILTVVAIAYGWAGLHFYLASRTIGADIARAEAGH
jgi:predicted MFS family arabinose efflux permease